MAVVGLFDLHLVFQSPGAACGMLRAVREPFERHQLATFVKRGYRYCWDPKHGAKVPAAVKEKFPQIQPGDRIAAKKMLGQGSRSIQIRAIGVVKDVDH